MGRVTPSPIDPKEEAAALERSRERDPCLGGCLCIFQGVKEGGLCPRCRGRFHFPTREEIGPLARLPRDDNARQRNDRGTGGRYLPRRYRVSLRKGLPLE